MIIGQRIKERRKALRMSADDLASALHVSRATIYRYENGDIEKLPVNIMEPLVEALQTSPQYLMGWIDDPKPIAVEKNQQQKYYLDEETAQIVEAMATNPELRALYYLQRKMSKDEIDASTAFYNAMASMKRKEERINDDDSC